MLGVTRHTAQPSGMGVSQPCNSLSAFMLASCCTGSQHALRVLLAFEQGASLSAPLSATQTSPVKGLSRMQWGPPTQVGMSQDTLPSPLPIASLSKFKSAITLTATITVSQKSSF